MKFAVLALLAGFASASDAAPAADAQGTIAEGGKCASGPDSSGDGCVKGFRCGKIDAVKAAAKAAAATAADATAAATAAASTAAASTASITTTPAITTPA